VRARMRYILSRIIFILLIGISLDVRAISLNTQAKELDSFTNQVNEIAKKFEQKRRVSNNYLHYYKNKLSKIYAAISRKQTQYKEKLEDVKSILNKAKKANLLGDKPLVDLKVEQASFLSNTIQEEQKKASFYLGRLLQIDIIKSNIHEIRVDMNRLENEINYGSIWRGNYPFFKLKAWLNLKKEYRNGILLKYQLSTPQTMKKKGKPLPLLFTVNLAILYIIIATTLVKINYQYFIGKIDEAMGLFFIGSFVILCLIPHYLLYMVYESLISWSGQSGFFKLKYYNALLNTCNFILLVISIFAPTQIVLKKYHQMALSKVVVSTISIMTALILFINNADIFSVNLFSRPFFSNQIVSFATLILMLLVFFICIVTLKKNLLIKEYHE
jgi:hypothetical protein